MFDTFGEFDSIEEINEAAKNQLAEGDTQAIRDIARENGIDPEDAEDYITGAYPTLISNPIMGALGKLDVEEKALEIKGDILISDWVGYIRGLASSDEKIARNVRKKGKSLAGCIAELLKYSFKNQWTVPKDIQKASGVSASRVTFGVPSQGKSKEIIRKYYS